MSAAQVIVQEYDLSTRVPSFQGVYASIVVPAKKGRTDRPSLVTSDSDLLRKYTPEETIKVGYDLSYYSALAFLEKSQTLWVQRAMNDGFYSGLIIQEEGTPAVKAAFSGAIAGVTDDVELSAVVEGVVGNSILLTGDGTKDLATLVSDWNTANAANMVELLSSNGTDIPDNAEAMQLVSGADATTENSGIASGSDVSDPDAYVMDDEDALFIYSANEGDWGNDIGIKLTNYATDPDKVKEPNSFLIEVFHKNNEASPVEEFVCSRVEGAKDGFGLNIFVEDVLESSNYIRGISNPLVEEDTPINDQLTILYMLDGDDGSAVTDTNMIAYLQNFANSEEIYTTLLMDGGYTTAAYQVAMNTIAVNRKDCVAILSTPYSAEINADPITAIVAYRKTDLNLNSSYSALYTPHIQTTDRFNDRQLWVAPDGYAAAAISETGSNQELWYPVAGFRRGVLSVEDTRLRFSQGQMDLLYDNQVNPIRFFSGRGIVIWGQKTLSSRPSALDRLNVRLLLVVIEPAIKRVLEDFLFELNDIGTRNIIKALIQSYMDAIQSRRGVEAYSVVCDDTNNTANDVDNNRLIVDLFIRPTRSIEEIKLRVVITSSSITFEEAAQAL